MSTDRRASPYAVPLSTLVAGAHVPTELQTTEHPPPPAPDRAAGSAGIPYGDSDGSDGD